jgi:hypothetical protein
MHKLSGPVERRTDLQPNKTTPRNSSQRSAQSPLGGEHKSASGLNVPCVKAESHGSSRPRSRKCVRSRTLGHANTQD